MSVLMSELFSIRGKADELRQGMACAYLDVTLKGLNLITEL